MLNKKGKYEKGNSTKDIYQMLIPSVLGVFLCIVCLVGSTLAWFSAAPTLVADTIRTANYEMVTVIKGSDGQELSVDAEGEYLLSVGEYKVSLTASGTAENGGYCIFRFFDDENSEKYTEMHTFQIYADSPVSFALTIEGSDGVKLRIVPQWGTSSQSDDSRINFENGYTYTK